MVGKSGEMGMTTIFVKVLVLCWGKWYDWMTKKDGNEWELDK